MNIDIEQIYGILKSAKLKVDKFEEKNLGAPEKKLNIYKSAVAECLELMSEIEDRELLPEISTVKYRDNSFVSD